MRTGRTMVCGRLQVTDRSGSLRSRETGFSPLLHDLIKKVVFSHLYGCSCTNKTFPPGITMLRPGQGRPNSNTAAPATHSQQCCASVSCEYLRELTGLQASLMNSTIMSGVYASKGSPRKKNCFKWSTSPRAYDLGEQTTVFFVNLLHGRQ